MLNHPHYQRLAITVPEGMATQIDRMCKLEGRSRSEFFREAVRLYFSTKRSTQGSTAMVLPNSQTELEQENPFYFFSEWDSPEDAVYDTLT